MRLITLSILGIIFGASASAGPFDRLPTMACSQVDGFAPGSAGVDAFALWVHGYASGVMDTDPTAGEGILPSLTSMRDAVKNHCGRNQNDEISSDLLNNLYEAVD